jgi:hypothetical protein
MTMAKSELVITRLIERAVEAFTGHGFLDSPTDGRYSDVKWLRSALDSCRDEPLCCQLLAGYLATFRRKALNFRCEVELEPSLARHGLVDTTPPNDTVLAVRDELGCSQIEAWLIAGGLPDEDGETQADEILVAFANKRDCIRNPDWRDEFVERAND